MKNNNNLNSYERTRENKYDGNQDEEEEERDDFLSKNIDSIKEMLEATKRDLERLDGKGQYSST